MRLRGGALRAVAGLAGVGFAAAALAACGENVDMGGADVDAGKQRFTGLCGSCHTLQAAGTKGRVGPNLDDAFRAARLQGWEDSEFAGFVKEWITIAEPPMPRNLVKGTDADNVAAYIALVAGRNDESAVRPAREGAPGTTPPKSPEPRSQQPSEPATTGANTTATTAQPPASGGSGATTIEADPSGQLRWEQKRVEVDAGRVTLRMDNPSSTPHNLALRMGVSAGPTQTVTMGTAQLTVQLKPGQYQFYCAVPGHAEAGMVGTLVVN